LLPAALAPAMRGSDVFAALHTLAPALFAVGLGLVAYTGVAAGIGTLFPRRPLLGGFLYILVIEELLANLPGALKIVAVSFHLRVVAGMTGQTGSLFSRWGPRPEPWVATIVALAMGGLWMLLATWLVTNAEYRESSR